MNASHLPVVSALWLLLLSASGCEMDDDAPPILFWVSRPHEDRGECTDCHVRVNAAGVPLPSITSASRMPHLERGVCTNCHRVRVPGR